MNPLNTLNTVRVWTSVTWRIHDAIMCCIWYTLINSIKVCYWKCAGAICICLYMGASNFANFQTSLIYLVILNWINIFHCEKQQWQFLNKLCFCLGSQWSLRAPQSQFSCGNLGVQIMRTFWKYEKMKTLWKYAVLGHILPMLPWKSYFGY